MQSLFSYKDYHQHFMAETQKTMESSSQSQNRLQLYVYGSCESDQYYHPSQQSESKRPICLSEIEQFEIEAEDQDQQGQDKIIKNPIYRAQIFKIACGALHTIVVTGEGQVYTFGCNDQGALGRQGLEKIPQLVSLPDPIDLISAGDNHSVFANSQVGSVYFSGNYKYMRGESISTRVSTPIKTEVGQLDTRMKNVPIQKVVSGSNHSAILVGGKIFIRGEPEAHTVGRRINERHKAKSSLTFDSVGLNHVEELWCGGYHSIAKVKKGKDWHYYAWGLNKHGQLGLRNYEESPYPQQLKKLKGKNIIDVAAGTNFTVLLTEQGQLFGCGQNDDGQLGLGQDYVYVDSEEEELQKEVERKMNLEEKVQVKQNSHQNVQKQQQKKQQQQKVQAPANKQQEIKEMKNEQKQQEKKQVIQNEQIKASEQKIEQDPQVQQHAQPSNQPIVESIPSKIASQNRENKVQAHEQKQSPIKAIKKLEEENIYIKSFKKIKIQQKLTHITAGSQFCFGWNNQSLYSWGFGSNFVLLNGQEEDEYRPFKVKSRIINEHAIYDVAAGAQHVVYLSYPTHQPRPSPKMSEAALQRSVQARQKLSRRKKN